MISYHNFFVVDKCIVFDNATMHCLPDEVAALNKASKYSGDMKSPSSTNAMHSLWASIIPIFLACETPATSLYMTLCLNRTP